jgi:dynein heavy chain
VDVILATMPKDSSAVGGMSCEDVVDALAAELLAKVPPVFEGEPAREKLKKLGPTQPLTIHLRQEVRAGPPWARRASMWGAGRGPTFPLPICSLAKRASPSLTLQIDRLNRVLTATSSLLKNLRLAIAGTIALTDG